MMLLFKIWNYCQDNPNSLALIVRKEYTDLRDSTIKDFQLYFGVSVDSNKEYKFANGSVIMFRHGSELNVLKNINLSIAGIEQAEEFETEEPFIFIRDRLRRANAPYHQLCIIGNVNGHNWIWRMFKNNPAEDYDLSEATTFDNADVLPEDFIEDRRKLAIEAPNHFKRFVMNDWEEMEADDYVFTWVMLDASIKLNFIKQSLKRILAVDCARFGDDETVFTILENRSLKLWEETYIEEYRNKDLMWTVGRFIDLKREFDTDIHIVDDIGIGGGVTDRLRELNIPVRAFIANEKAKNEELFANKRSEGFFQVRKLVETNQLKILDNHRLIDQLLTIRYKYNSKGQKLILSKDELRKEGIKSPDMADALMMAVSGIGRTEEAIYHQELTPAPKLY